MACVCVCGISNEVEVISEHCLNSDAFATRIKHLSDATDDKQIMTSNLLYRVVKYTRILYFSKSSVTFKI